MRQNFLFIILSLLLINSCIDSSDDVCSETFNEYESNDTVSSYNSFGIILKNGCSVSIKGTMTDSDFNDYFIFNTGDAAKIKFTVTWDNANFDLDLRLVDEANLTIKQSFGINDLETFTWTPDLSYYPRFIIIDNVFPPAGETANYTLKIEESS